MVNETSTPSPLSLRRRPPPPLKQVPPPTKRVRVGGWNSKLLLLYLSPLPEDSPLHGVDPSAVTTFLIKKLIFVEKKGEKKGETKLQSQTSLILSETPLTWNLFNNHADDSLNRLIEPESETFLLFPFLFFPPPFRGRGATDRVLN